MKETRNEKRRKTATEAGKEQWNKLARTTRIEQKQYHDPCCMLICAVCFVFPFVFCAFALACCFLFSLAIVVFFSVVFFLCVPLLREKQEEAKEKMK